MYVFTSQFLRRNKFEQILALFGVLTLVTDASFISNTAGVILAGGKSRRFGSNKALALLNGKPVIQHVAEIITSLFSSCLVVTNTPEEYAFLELPMVGDIFPDAGPLAGIHAALSHIAEPQAFVTACDMPFLDAGLVQFLCSVADTVNCHAVIPHPDDRPQPLYAIYHKSSLTLLGKNLQNCKRGIIETLTELNVYWIDEETILSHVNDLATFHNVNQPEDLSR
jgi:molybdopterin-guanine dinucleotide biosynthesis protein A